MSKPVDNPLSDDAHLSPQGSSKRRFIKTAGLLAAAAALSPAPFIRKAWAAEPLKISTFGGAFGQGFAEHLFPAFTRATGIPVQRVEQASGSQFLLQLAQANASGNVPMDLCMMVDAQVLRGRARNLWHNFKPDDMPRVQALDAAYRRATDRGVDGVGALAYFMTLAVNPDMMDPLPDSWQVLWDKHPDYWGVQSGSQSPMLEIAANLYFGGNDILNSEAGIDKVIAKIAEIRPNVKLWWQDEGTMQTALQNEEVVGGTFIHDTTVYLQQNGTSVRSIFPREGALQGVNYWCQPSGSKRQEEARAFLEWSSSPEAQQIVARKLMSAPILPKSQMNLSDAEFALVSSERKPFPIATEARMRFADYLEQQFTRMLRG